MDRKRALLQLCCLSLLTAGVSRAQPALAVDNELLKKETSESHLLKGSVKKFEKSKRFDLELEKKDEELSIYWDSWRNKFNRAIWAKFCKLLKGGDAFMLGNLVFDFGVSPDPQIPLGLKARYEAVVNNKQEVQSMRVLESSGNKEFDALVQSSVESVNGRNLLRFPAASKRETVSISAVLFTTKNGHFEAADYADVEKLKLLD